MIWTVMHVSGMRLWHNKPELLLTFVVPMVFFSIFAWIFGSRPGQVDVRPLKIVVCDEANTTLSRSLISTLSQTPRVNLHCPVGEQTKRISLDRLQAEQLVRRGLVSAAIVMTANEAVSEQPLQIEILSDSFDQVSSQVVLPLVKEAGVKAYSLAHQQAVAKSKVHFASHTSSESTALDSPQEPASFVQPTSLTTTPSPSTDLPTPDVAVVDVLGHGKANPVVAMYAAGIAVMFLLFSTTTASGSLLEEKENSTLERILCSRATMDHLLMGKWCYLTLLGCLQTTAMFVLGAVCFHLDLVDHLGGFALMTVVTSGAAASFALMLAAACRTRTQLGWVSTILILSMSALGGSMVPRYLMNDDIKRFGQITFNAWALDGYNKVFWRELPLVELTPELSVLVGCAFVFLLIARASAMTWERV